MNYRTLAIALVVLIGAGCHNEAARPTAPSEKLDGAGAGSDAAAAPAPAPAPVEDVELNSKDILARTDIAPEVYVKHVLIAWKALASVYPSGLDPRADARSNAQAAALARDVYAKLQADPSAIDALIRESSEDPGSLGDPYMVKADAPFVTEFKDLAIRLKENEAGIVRTKFGYHVMLRVAKPLPDPLESADVLARKPLDGPIHVQHIVIGWKDTAATRAGASDPRAAERAKPDADKLASEVLRKVRAKGDMAKLMKQYSEDPSSKDNARSFEIAGEMPSGFESFKDLAFRLKLGEAGLVKTPLGWHIVKRVPPPPPDALDSVAILKRKPAAENVKVKHILLGWTEAHAQDERGTKRSRADLEKLVKATVAKLKKGDKIEPLMAELSEDDGSASSGNSYDVSPDAPLVPPFKDLSLRLKVGEVGVVKTVFGIHIVQRVE